MLKQKILTQGKEVSWQVKSTLPSTPGYLAAENPKGRQQKRRVFLAVTAIAIYFGRLRTAASRSQHRSP